MQHLISLFTSEDPRQRIALGYLDELHKSLVGYEPPKRALPGEKKGFLGGFWKSKEENPDEYGWEPKFDDTLKGLYLYGSVGTGKTLIMDMLYETSPIVKKKRSHFHEFMLDVHRRKFHGVSPLIFISLSHTCRS